MTKIKPHWQILGALLLATILAFLFRAIDANAEGGFIVGMVTTCEFLGEDVFMGALKMIIVPLIVSSVVSGIASLHGLDGFGRLLGKTAGFYALTSLLAIIVGLAMVNTLKPGLVDGKPNEKILATFNDPGKEAMDAGQPKVAAAQSKAEKTGGLVVMLRDFVKRMIPTNVLNAATDNGAMLGLICFSILFAIGMTRLPTEQVGPLVQVFQALNDVMIVITRWIMALAPFGVFALLLPVVYKSGPDIFVVLGKYFFTVLAALLFHFAVTMPLVLKFIGRVSPWAHFKAMRTALLTAFSTASSASTLPVTMRCIQENAGVSKRTSSFTVPLGATVNMDGTALYECVAVIFVAQVMSVPLDLGEQFMIVLAALLTSVGVAGIPSASLVAIFIILQNSGIPGADKAIIALLAVDRLLDMCRTSVNVLGDSCAAVVVAKSEGEEVLVQDSAKAT